MSLIDICCIAGQSRYAKLSHEDNLFNGIYIELAKGGLPLPFGNRFWASNWPFKTPLPGLLIHLIPSVLSIFLYSRICANAVQVIVIIAPPPAIAYPFILDVQGYPQQIVNLFVVLVKWLIHCALPMYSPYTIGFVLAPMEEA